MTDRVLPFIRDLNPNIDDMGRLLGLAHKHQGNRASLAKGISKSRKAAGKRKGFTEHSILANTISSLGPENLGILTDDARLTKLGRDLYALRNKPRKLRDALTQEILLRHGGWQFARALETLGQQGKRPSRLDIASYLAEKYGIEEWRDLNNISSLHNFLKWGGVVKNYRLNMHEFERLAGTAMPDVHALEAFSQDTRDCFEALVRLGGVATAGDIRNVAEAQRGRLLDVHQMPAILAPLVDATIVEFAGKRGDRKSLYGVVDRHKAEALAHIAEDLSLSGVVPDAVFDETFAWVVKRLKRKNLSRDKRGRTLEILAAKICWRLGLRHIQIRKRTDFEVDVVADRVGMGYQRWLVQCKAYGQSQVGSEHILREFGIAALSGYDVILFVTTSDYSDDAIRTLTNIIRRTNILVLPISGADLDAFAKNESRLHDFVQTRSSQARRLRLGATPDDVFRKLDEMKDWILSEKPSVTHLHANLQRRRVFVETEVLAAMFVAWLEGLRTEDGFDEDYLAAARSF